MKKKALSYLKQSSPVVLTFMGAIGVVATAVITARAAPKALDVLKEREKEKGEPLEKLEAVKYAAPIYIPAALMGVSTIVCIFGANVLSRKNQASLISAYALLDESYKKYQKAAVQVYGEDADSKIKAEAAKETYITEDGRSLYEPDLDVESEKFLFYDYYSSRYFTSSIPAVINAQYHINRNLALKGEVTLNEFYEFLGLEEMEGGDEVGWNIDDLITGGILWLDFENRYIELDDGLRCCIISFMYDPEILYL